ncbi:UV radiation resistance-associated gene protein-like isoform X1 [Neltuma alba]|uniref:UV radiation resistance-associated gene protein-like isoform X1 n=2 Tax=Neltuma alba TaxID=207710 RepID=UPI0010A57750|nr:UV radiation resistance-associated gene protein-like isoform X1 [Prosopis alba]
MEQNRNLSSGTDIPDRDNAKVIEWEDFEHDLARLVSLSSALNEAKEKKRNLQQKLEHLIQVKAESLSRSNELEEMRQKLESRKAMVENVSMHSRAAKEDATKKKEQLGVEVESLLVAGTALSVSRRRLQESNRLLFEEKGYVQLRNLQRMLRLRQQYMASQISMLYPVKISVAPAQEQELEAYPAGSIAGNSAEHKPVNQGSITILGLHLTMLSFKKMSFFTDKKEIQKSATALGYVAHAVSLIASYLQVPLRYPVRLGGSHSYIIDNAPSKDLLSSDSSSSTTPIANTKQMAFPLFSEGQDTTRAAYAVFLLNKDLEQLLNSIGARSLGPSHVLPNLRELLRTIQSSTFTDDMI